MFKIVKAFVLLDTCDRVRLTTDLPSPCPALSDEPLCMSFEVVRGGGIEYVRKHFGLEPMVVDVRKG